MLTCIWLRFQNLYTSIKSTPNRRIQQMLMICRGQSNPRPIPGVKGLQECVNDTFDLSNLLCIIAGFCHRIKFI